MYKRRLFNWLAVLWVGLLGLGLTSCGDDDLGNDPAKAKELMEKLQGTWEFRTGTGVDSSGEVKEVDNATLLRTENYLKMPTGRDVELRTLRFSGSTVNGMKYKVNDGNKLVLEDLEKIDALSIEVKEVTAETLTLHVEVGVISLTADLIYDKKME